MKKLLVLLLLLVLSVGLFSGCGEKETKLNGGLSYSDVDFAVKLTDIGKNMPAASYDFYSRDTLEITFMTPVWAPYTEDSTLVSYIEKATNTKLNMIWENNDTYQERIAAKLAENNLPDIIGCVPSLNYMNNQEAAYELQDLLKTYAPDYLNHLTSSTLLETTNLEDGSITSFASLREAGSGMTWLIRPDWLERVGSQMPQTFDEFVEVLRQFKAQDANGDGDPSNEIPFSGNVAFLRYCFGINGMYNFCIEDGVYKPVVLHSQYKNYLEAMQQMYAEGLLDAEYLSRDMWSQLLTLMDTNTLGCTVHFAERAKLDTEALRSAGFDGSWAGMNPVAATEDGGNLESQIGGMRFFCIASTVDEKKAIELVRFLNWFYTDEGIRLMNYGVEGVHHDVVNGEYVLREEYATYAPAREAGLIWQPMPFCWTAECYDSMAIAGMSVESMSETQKLFYDALVMNEDNLVEKCPHLTTEAWNQYQSSIEPQLAAFESNVITGNISMDDYDAELKKLLDAGLQDIADQAAAAYQAMVKE